MSKAKIYYCLNCERAIRVEGYLDSCPFCGRRRDLIEGQIPDKEPAETARKAANRKNLRLNLKQ